MSLPRVFDATEHSKPCGCRQSGEQNGVSETPRADLRVLDRLTASREEWPEQFAFTSLSLDIKRNG